MFLPKEWIVLATTVLAVLLTYIVIVLFLRLSGKRTLAKWNAFDYVVTIALGSMVATMAVSQSVSVLQGAVAIGTYLLLQVLVTFTSVRWKWFRSVLKGDPVLLLYHGEYREETMRRVRVTKSEVLAAIRESGQGSVESVGAVVLENDGTFSVIGSFDAGESALQDVGGWQQV